MPIAAHIEEMVFEPYRLECLADQGHIPAIIFGQPWLLARLPGGRLKHPSKLYTCVAHEYASFVVSHSLLVYQCPLDSATGASRLALVALFYPGLRTKNKD